MKYILIFYAFWPGTSSEGMIVEPFDTLSECQLAAERMWEVVQADGADDYQAHCGILHPPSTSRSSGESTIRLVPNPLSKIGK